VSSLVRRTFFKSVQSAILLRIDQRDTILVQFDLSKFDLSGANLSEANLYMADLYIAELHKANLYMAELISAMGLTGEQRVSYQSRGAIIDPFFFVQPSGSTV
jgi:hypothetical protein